MYNPPSFLTLASILRAAQTLSFMDISSFATRAIKDIWSSKIERVTSVPVPHAYEAFTLSKQFHMPCVTKRAAYELMRLEAFGLEDISWGNTTLGSSASEFADFGISKGDLVQLMKVRLKLQVAWYTVISSPQSGFGSVCTFAAKDDVPDTNSHCLSPPMREKHWNSTVTDSNVFERFMCDPLCGLNHLATLKWKQMGFCTGCVHKKKEVWRKCGEKIWEDMDLWLDLRTDE